MDAYLSRCLSVQYVGQLIRVVAVDKVLSDKYMVVGVTHFLPINQRSPAVIVRVIHSVKLPASELL